MKGRGCTRISQKGKMKRATIEPPSRWRHTGSGSRRGGTCTLVIWAGRRRVRFLWDAHIDDGKSGAKKRTLQLGGRTGYIHSPPTKESTTREGKEHHQIDAKRKTGEERKEKCQTGAAVLLNGKKINQHRKEKIITSPTSRAGRSCIHSPSYRAAPDKGRKLGRLCKFEQRRGRATGSKTHNSTRRDQVPQGGENARREIHRRGTAASQKGGFPPSRKISHPALLKNLWDQRPRLLRKGDISRD